VLTVEHDFEGEYGSGRWIFVSRETGEQRVLDGKRASLLSMLLADTGYELRPDFKVTSPFTEESLKRGREA
jgi:hypothetical protein